MRFTTNGTVFPEVQLELMLNWKTEDFLMCCCFYLQWSSCLHSSPVSDSNSSTSCASSFNNSPHPSQSRWGRLPRSTLWWFQRDLCTSSVVILHCAAITHELAIHIWWKLDKSDLTLLLKDTVLYHRQV